jgi:hypothetical protein
MFGAPFPGGQLMEKTFNGTSVSSMAVDRYVVGAIGWGAGNISSATLAGIAASILVQGTPSVGAGLISALIPAGVSGAVVVNGVTNADFRLYDIIGWDGTVGSTQTSSSSPTSSLSLTAPDNSCVIAALAAQDNSTADPTASATWTNLTEDADIPYGVSNVRYFSCASRLFTVGASITATCTHSHSGGAQFAAAAVLRNA